MGGDSRERRAAGCGREVETDRPRDLIAFFLSLQGPGRFLKEITGT